MMDFFELLASTQTLSPAKRRETLRPYADRKTIGSLFIRLKGEKNVRLVLRALADLASYPDIRQFILHYIDLDPSVLEHLFSFPDAKARKNLYELIGKTRPDLYFDSLSQALLGGETTDFNRPSLILAIGNCKNKSALLLLKEYQLPPCGEKHEAEAKIALSKALSHLCPEKKVVPSVLPIPSGTDVLLSCPNASITVRELSSLGFSAQIHPFLQDFVLVKNVKEYASLLAARSFFSAYFFYSSVSHNISDLCLAVKNKAFGTFLRSLFPAPISYRIEITSSFPDLKISRAAVSAQISQAIGETHGFSNNPSSYQCTLFLYYTKQSVLLMATPSPLLDKRFSYRKKSVSASIAPAAAAACMQAAKEYFRPDASVLDCFCGSGTMLLERAKFPFGSLTGSDISTQALAAARANQRIAKVPVQWILKNAATPFTEQFDEVISNMPFGLRVSNHEKNSRLYRSFFDNLSSFLKIGGYAFLFTQEKQLCKDILALHPELTRLGVFRLHTGGLYPNLYLLQRK